jgi:hypothetical protein
MTVRHLKPGSFDAYLDAWKLDAQPPGWTRICTVRGVADPDEVVSFGFFDGTMEDLRRSQQEFDYAAQRTRVQELVESTGTDGVFEVVFDTTG